MKWIAVLATFPLPILLLGTISCSMLLFVTIILISCIPLAGERLIRVLAFFKEAFYDGQTVKPVRQTRHQPRRGGRRK